MGITNFDIVQANDFIGLGSQGGKTFYVNASGVVAPGGRGASDGNSGENWQEPFLTIQKAVDSCVSGRGDIIKIAPGSYAENVVINAKDYITLEGAFHSGYARPDVVPTSGKALYVEASQGIVCKHIRFAAPAADTDLVLQEGNGFLFDDCVFDGHATQGNAKALVRLKGNASDDSYTASEGVIQNCLFRASGGIGLIFDTGAAPGNGVGCTDITLLGNKFVANDQQDITTADTGSGTYSIQNGLIEKNVFASKNKSVYIDFTTSNGGAASDQTGVIAGNWFASDTITTTNVAMVGTGFTFAGNYTTVGIKDGSGID